MKTTELPNTTQSGKQNFSTSNVATKDNYHGSSVTELLKIGLKNRQTRLDADDMLTTDQAADLVGTSRVTVNAWISKGRAIGLTQIRRGFKLPVWQFQSQIWEILPQLTSALQSKEGWEILTFLETPHGALHGMTPRVALEQGNIDQVLKLAAAEGN